MCSIPGLSKGKRDFRVLEFVDILDGEAYFLCLSVHVRGGCVVASVSELQDLNPRGSGQTG